MTPIGSRVATEKSSLAQAVRTYSQNPNEFKNANIEEAARRVVPKPSLGYRAKEVIQWIFAKIFHRDNTERENRIQNRRENIQEFVQAFQSIQALSGDDPQVMQDLLNELAAKLEGYASDAETGLILAPNTPIETASSKTPEASPMEEKPPSDFKSVCKNFIKEKTSLEFSTATQRQNLKTKIKDFQNNLKQLQSGFMYLLNKAYQIDQLLEKLDFSKSSLKELNAFSETLDTLNQAALLEKYILNAQEMMDPKSPKDWTKTNLKKETCEKAANLQNTIFGNICSNLGIEFGKFPHKTFAEYVNSLNTEKVDTAKEQLNKLVAEYKDLDIQPSQYVDTAKSPLVQHLQESVKELNDSMQNCSLYSRSFYKDTHFDTLFDKIKEYQSNLIEQLNTGNPNDLQGKLGEFTDTLETINQLVTIRTHIAKANWMQRNEAEGKPLQWNKNEEAWKNSGGLKNLCQKAYAEYSNWNNRLLNGLKLKPIPENFNFADYMTDLRKLENQMGIETTKIQLKTLAEDLQPLQNFDPRDYGAS